MKRRPLPALLLLATALLGQWLFVAHAVQHEALEPASTLCDYCGIGTAPPPDHGGALLPPRPATRPRPALAAGAPISCCQRLERIRGPPRPLV